MFFFLLQRPVWLYLLFIPRLLWHFAIRMFTWKKLRSSFTVTDLNIPVRQCKGLWRTLMPGMTAPGRLLLPPIERLFLAHWPSLDKVNGSELNQSDSSLRSNSDRLGIEIYILFMDTFTSHTGLPMSPAPTHRGTHGCLNRHNSHFFLEPRVLAGGVFLSCVCWSGPVVRDLRARMACGVLLWHCRCALIIQ